MNKAEHVFNKLAQEKFNITKAPQSGVWDTTVVKKFDTPAGPRFYTGQHSSRDMSMAQNRAVFNARIKATTNPADSVTTQQFNNFK